MTNESYELYKKRLGESPAKLIRSNYPEVLDDFEFLDYIFKRCKTKTNIHNVFSNIENLLYMKNSYFEDKKEQEDSKNTGDLEEVLGKVGYDHKIIDSVGDLMKFKKYYASGELLCTYNNPEERLNDYHMIVLFKKGLEQIKRSNTPKREDEYSTSLLNTQIHKKHGNVSIKSRYNHTVNNPDAVFSNNLDRIAEGLTSALERKFKVKINRSGKEQIPDNLKVVNDFVINYWIERNNVYVGEDVYVDNDNVFWIDPNKELIVDTFLVNFEEKTVKNLIKTNDPLQKHLEIALKENKLDLKKLK